MAPDPKTAKRYKASLSEWEWFRTWFHAEKCWVCGKAWQELHHILPRSHSGDDVIENLAPVCSEDHRRIEARNSSARALLRGALTPANLAYLHDKLGERTLGWLERNYPARVAA